MKRIKLRYGRYNKQINIIPGITVFWPMDYCLIFDWLIWYIEIAYNPKNPAN